MPTYKSASGESYSAVIDLTIDSKDFTSENIIHQAEFKKVVDLIEKQIPSDLKAIIKTDELEGYYMSILVEGGRGTGKTTFLKNFFNKSIRESHFNEIEVLPFLDPTRIEDKSSIFLTIISLIKEKVCDKLCCQANKCDDGKYSIEYKRKAWKDTLNHLSKGLPSIDDNPKVPHYWDDDFMIMEKGLDATKSAFNLRTDFKKLVKESLEILGKKAFLLIVDDVDTDCKKAWSLLETLRKYLCIYGFITIVSGNMELFSLEIRQEQSKRFTKSPSDEKENRIIKNQIIELTDQYIRKIFPPAHRVSLGKLNYITEMSSIFNSDKPLIFIKTNPYRNTDNQNPVIDTYPLIDYIKDIFFTLGIKNKYQITAYTDFILNLPLRTQIDFYRMFEKFYYDFPKEQSVFPLSVEEITNLFIEDLIQHKIDDSILAERPYTINSVILKFLIEGYGTNNNLNDYYQLQPITLDKSLNGVLFSLGILLSILIHINPELIFSYMIKIGLVRNVTQILKKKTEKGYDFSVGDMVRYCALCDDMDLRHSMCVMTAYVRSASAKIPGIFEISKTNKNKLFKQTGLSIGKYIAQLPYSCSRDAENSKDYYEYSIYTLIASVFDIVRANEAGEDFEDILRKNCQPREFLMVSGNSDDFTDTESKEVAEKSEENSDNINFSNVSGFYDELLRWMEFIKRLGKYIQPYVLAKICTRMYYAYSNVELKKSNTNRSVYEIMQEYIFLMFNSVIIEELAEHNPSDRPSGEGKVKINRENTIKSFYENLKAVTGHISVEDIPLCEIFLTCPFFLFFVDFSDEKNNEIVNFCNKVAGQENLSRYSAGKFDSEFYKNNACVFLKKSAIKAMLPNERRKKSSEQKENKSESDTSQKAVTK